jgi:hypothetical protein
VRRIGVALLAMLFVSNRVDCPLRSWQMLRKIAGNAPSGFSKTPTRRYADTFLRRVCPSDNPWNLCNLWLKKFLFFARLEVGRLGRRRGRFDRAIATVILSLVRIKKKVKGQKQCL